MFSSSPYLAESDGWWFVRKNSRGVCLVPEKGTSWPFALLCQICEGSPCSLDRWLLCWLLWTSSHCNNMPHPHLFLSRFDCACGRYVVSTRFSSAMIFLISLWIFSILQFALITFGLCCRRIWHSILIQLLTTGASSGNGGTALLLLWIESSCVGSWVPGPRVPVL